MEGYEELANRAMDSFVARCLVPIIVESGTMAAIQGTGTLFELANRSFLVTAAHVFEDVSFNDVGIGVGGGEIHTLDSAKIHRFLSGPPDPDVAVVELSGTPIERECRETYTLLGADQLAPHGARYERYLVAGFPRDVADHGPSRITPRPIKIVTRVYAGDLAAASPIDSQLDLLLTHDRAGRIEDGSIHESPRNGGMSGASIWGLEHANTSALWTAHRALRVVGVLASTKHGHYMRCKRWYAVALILERVDPALGTIALAALQRP